MLVQGRLSRKQDWGAAEGGDPEEALSSCIHSSPVSSRMERLKEHYLDQWGIWDCSVLEGECLQNLWAW